MAALPYMQLYVADYLADTAHLTAAQHGAYLLLIFNYWQRGKPLNNLNERLANVARMNGDEWAEAKPVLAEFFEIDGDEWKHLRIDRDLEAVNSKSSKASEAGKASAARKAEKRSTVVEQTSNHTDVDTDKDKDKPLEPSALVASKLPTCPQSEIIELFADELPELPQPRVWDGVREKNLRTRWRWVLADLKAKGRPCTDADALAFFRRMFAYIRKSDFLMGRTGDWSCPGLHWVVEPANFAKIIEGAYDNKAAA